MQNKTVRALPGHAGPTPARAEEPATLLLDQRGIVQHCSRRLIRLLGAQRRALQGQPLAHLLPGFPMRPETPGYNRAFAAFWQDRGVWQQQADKIDAGAGSALPGKVIEATVRPLAPRDGRTEPMFLVGLRFTGRMVDRCPAVERQNEALKDALRRLQHEGTHDSLTGLPNRGLFLDRLGQHLARSTRHGTRFALACLNLDGFRAINDRHGHAAGDAVLQACAHQLHASLRGEDTVGRLGGDEFGLILTDLHGEDSLRATLDKILAAVGQDIDYAGKPLRIGATLGVSLYPEGGRDADSLMRQADRAMRRGKHEARGQICRGEAMDY